jgi:DNA-binding response OmpR family regulator
MDTKKQLIAIVEDDALLGRALTDKLQLEGFDVKLIVDGADAVSTIKEIKPQLILLDVMLPHVDGFGVLRALKADEDVLSIPVIMLTNLSQETDQSLGLELGAVEYLVKSDHMLAEIVKTIHNHL